ncbi:hypothetical protein [Haloarcula halophila]|uniref:hypothetical protein n=1 Tax=Haloarcula halophila TaxID=3032584 RepID=UPI0023E358ED|nr:hypothetical protein [Halomicroarcula sp. DFY41]
MPFIARLGSRGGELVSPGQVDAENKLYCPECGGEMGIRDGDGKKRHFWHTEKLGGADGHECDGVGRETAESEIHSRVKAYAVEALADRFVSLDTKRNGEEIPVEVAETSSKSDYRRADAMAEFEAENRLFGRGLAVEIQHRHEEKNIPRVSADFIEAGYTVLWIDTADVETQREFPDIDLALQSEQFVSYTPYNWSEIEVLNDFAAEEWFQLEEDWQQRIRSRTAHTSFNNRARLRCVLCVKPNIGGMTLQNARRSRRHVASSLIHV